MLALSARIPEPARTPSPSNAHDQSATRRQHLSLTTMMPQLSLSPSSSERQHNSLPLQRVSRPQKPRLKLETQEVFQPTTFAKGGTSSLRLETLSAASPTVRNTFSNTTYARPSPQPNLPCSSSLTSIDASRPARPRLSLNVDTVTDGNQEDISSPNNALTPVSSSGSVSSSASTDSSLSSDSASVVVPYRPSFSIHSILRNSPLPRVARASSLQAQPLFPAPKRVCFRSPLEEEVITAKYTVSHYELVLPVAEEGDSHSTAASGSSRRRSTKSSNSALVHAVSDKSTNTKAKHIRRSSESGFSSAPRTGDKRESDDSDSDTCPETPVAGRRKKQREWVWTLGPIEGQQAAGAEEDVRLPDLR